MSVGSLYRAHLERACAPAYVPTAGSGPSYFVAFQTPAALRWFLRCRKQVKAWAQLIVQARLRSESRAPSSQNRRRKSDAREPWNQVRRSTRPWDARSFVVALQLEAAELKRPQLKTGGQATREARASTLTSPQRVGVASRRTGRTCSRAYGIKVRPKLWQETQGTPAP